MMLRPKFSEIGTASIYERTPTMKTLRTIGFALNLMILSLRPAITAQDQPAERTVANQHAPPEAYLEGAELPYFGSQDPWALDAKPYDSTGGPDDTWYGFQEERREIFGFLTEYNIGGVVLISADRHRSDVRINEREDDYPLFEFESRRLTNNGAHDHVGVTLFSYNELQSFGVLGFRTMSDDPEVSGTFVTIDGEVVYRLRLNRSQLRSGG